MKKLLLLSLFCVASLSFAQQTPTNQTSKPAKKVTNATKSTKAEATKSTSKYKLVEVNSKAKVADIKAQAEEKKQIK